MDRTGTMAPTLGTKLKTHFIILFAAFTVLPSSAFAKWPFYFFGPALQDANGIKLQDGTASKSLLSYADAQERICKLSKDNCRLDPGLEDVAKFNGRHYQFLLTELHEKPELKAPVVGYWVQYFADYDRAEIPAMPIHEKEWEKSFLILKNGKRIAVRDALYKFGSPGVVSSVHKLISPYLQASDAYPKTFDNQNRDYWLKTFETDRAAGFWFKQNTWVVTPQYSYLNYQMIPDEAEPSTLDAKRTKTNLENLLPGTESFFSVFKSFSAQPKAVRVNGKWSIEKIQITDHYPGLSIINAYPNEIEVGVLYHDALYWSGFSPLEAKKLTEMYSDKCETHKKLYWLSSFALKKFPLLTFKIPLSKLKDSQISPSLRFEGSNNFLSFKENPKLEEYMKLRKANQSKPFPWLIDHWFLNYQKSIETRYLIRSFSKEEYDQMMKDADQKISEACKNEPTKKVP